MRGERSINGLTPDVMGGSSPHARGTRIACRWRPAETRFIPACAGNAGPYSCAPVSSSVHPRMRGERFCAASWRLELGGSSPHARGTLLGVELPGHAPRFIPACAGNAFRRVPASGLTTVHPRMRGERVCTSAKRLPRFGSSPHARGTRRAWGPGCGSGPVHPRMRGERPRKMARHHERIGSSPHARGTQDEEWQPRDITRFIPACAGNATLWKDS